MNLDSTVKGFISAIIENKSDEISNYSDKILSCFKDAISNDCIESFWSSLEDSENKLEALINYLQINDNPEKEKVYYFSTLSTVIDLTKQLSVDNSEKEEFKSYSNYKYIYPILIELSKCNFLTHKELSEKLNISTNTLSNFIRRTNDFNLWSKRTIGKSSNYAITAKGKEALRLYSENNIYKNDGNLEKYTSILLDCILEEIVNGKLNENKVIHNINQQYNNGLSFLNSNLIKSKVKNILFMKNLNNIKDSVKNLIFDVQKSSSQYSFNEACQFYEQHNKNNYITKEEIVYDRI